MKAQNSGAGGAFGYAMAASGETLVVGAPLEASNGSDPATDGVPEAGAAYVLLHSGASWMQQAMLKAPSPTAGDAFGCSVAISGNTAVVGAPAEGTTGAAHVFLRGPDNHWTHVATLLASNAQSGDGFGWSVAVAGGTIVVGAYAEDGNGTGGESSNAAESAGAAYVFVRSGGAWTQQAYLKASNPGANDNFGWTVAVAGDTVAVGAPLEDGASAAPADKSTEAVGAVYVFTRTSGVWSQQARLKASNAGGADAFGYATALTGDTLIAGAPYESGNGTSPANDGAVAAGAVYAFTRSAGVWTQQSYLKAATTEADDRFGYAVATMGNLAAVGAIGEDSAGTGVNSPTQADNSAPGAGSVHVFEQTGGAWSQRDYAKATNSGAGDQFGAAVAGAGDVVVAGAPLEDSGATGIQTAADAGADNAAADSGAVFAFSSSDLSPLQSWRLAYFGTTGSAGDMADSDLDFVPNLLEFSTGTDPTSDVTGCRELLINGSVLRQRGQPTIIVTSISALSEEYAGLFCRRSDYTSTGLTYTAQFSGDLATWGSSTVTPTVIATDGQIDACTVPFPSLVNGIPPRFFRVTVSVSP